jgi:hypothetical protein
MNAYKFFGRSTPKETIARLKEILDCPYLWASSVTSFNDPFEFKVAFEFPEKAEEARIRYFEDNPMSSEANFQQWFGDLSQGNQWYIAQSIRESLIQSHAVCCLTKNFNNHLLWSHYANNHQGVCIEFDINGTQDIADFLCEAPVSYSKKKPRFNYFRDSIADFLNLTVFHKSESWSYEEEFRIVFNSSGKKVLKQNSIKRVYIGCRASSELKEFAAENQGKNGVIFFLMCEMPFDYELTPNIIEKNVAIMSSFF